MARNKKTTSSEVASLAAKVLADDQASKTAKRLAGSALSQVTKSHQTGSDLEELASTVARSPKYKDQTKTLAGSVLSQANKSR